jgi:hypothetical protein
MNGKGKIEKISVEYSRYKIKIRATKVPGE